MTTPYSYGAFAGDPAGQSIPAPAPARPKQVDMGFWLLMASAVATAATAVLYIVDFSSPLSHTYLSRSLELTAAETDDFIDVILVLIAVVGAVSIAMTILFGVFARKGHNWSRIVLLVFAAFSLTGLFGFDLSALAVASALSSLLYVAAAVMFFTSPASVYFNQMTQYRQAKKLNYPA